MLREDPLEPKTSKVFSGAHSPKHCQACLSCWVSPQTQAARPLRARGAARSGRVLPFLHPIVPVRQDQGEFRIGLLVIPWCAGLPGPLPAGPGIPQPGALLCPALAGPSGSPPLPNKALKSPELEKFLHFCT